MSKSSQNKRIILVAMNIVSMPFHDEHSPPFTVTLHINNTPVKMEVDTAPTCWAGT